MIMLTPIKFMECLNGFQKSAVARTAVELEHFQSFYSPYPQWRKQLAAS